MELEETLKLAKLKREKPEEYKKVLEQIEDISRDMIGLTLKIQKEIQEDIEA